jgi:hypothetical protein
MRLSHSIAVLLIPVLAGVSGCSSGNPMAPAKVSGRISYAGKPIKAGTMRFHTPNGTPYDAQISLDGTYTAVDIPEGDLVVTVETESINPNRDPSAGAKKNADTERRMKSMGMSRQSGPGANDAGGTRTASDASSNYMKIPEKYNSPFTSPLKVTLSRGRQTRDIDLTD